MLRRYPQEAPAKISDWNSKLLEVAESAAKLKDSYCRYFNRYFYQYPQLLSGMLSGNRS